MAEALPDSFTCQQSTIFEGQLAATEHKYSSPEDLYKQMLT